MKGQVMKQHDSFLNKQAWAGPHASVVACGESVKVFARGHEILEFGRCECGVEAKVEAKAKAAGLPSLRAGKPCEFYVYRVSKPRLKNPISAEIIEIIFAGLFGEDDGAVHKFTLDQLRQSIKMLGPKSLGEPTQEVPGLREVPVALVEEALEFHLSQRAKYEDVVSDQRVDQLKIEHEHAARADAGSRNESSASRHDHTYGGQRWAADQAARERTAGVDVAWLGRASDREVWAQYMGECSDDAIRSATDEWIDAQLESLGKLARPMVRERLVQLRRDVRVKHDNMLANRA